MLNSHLKNCSDLFRKLQNGVFLFYVEEDGRFIIKEIEPGAFLIKIEDIKRLLQDRFAVDENLATELLGILKERLKID